MGVSMHAAAQAPVQMQTQMQDREQVYGAELMTPQERNEYQTRMRTLKTEQERETFRLEHHKLMQERAKAQGKTLPAMPPAGQGGGMGPGMGPGMGSGMGSGMGGAGPRR
jgi:hypothetical protein